MDLRKPFNKSNVKGYREARDVAWFKKEVKRQRDTRLVGFEDSVREDVKEGEFKVTKLKRGQLYLNQSVPRPKPRPPKLKGHRRDINLIPVSELITILVQHQSKEG